MLKSLLANEFIVMAFDGILHLIAIWVLGLCVIIACKCLSRGHVNIKLLTATAIGVLLIIVRFFLLNKLGSLLPTADLNVINVLATACLYATCVILVYWLVTIPLLGSLFSSVAIIGIQLALSVYVPKLSYQIMPQGQRFAEYVGVANARNRQLMLEAKAFRKKSNGGIQQILADAADTIRFLTSGSEKETLSKDFASAVALYKDRKAYMDNMTPEELAAYRKAMSGFLSEQGLDENRYSLSNLKNAKPDDLKNLATFMKEMNGEYQFTNQLPDDLDPDSDVPPSAESLAFIAQSLSEVDLSNEDMAKLGSLFNNLGIDTDLVMANMASVQEDLAGIRDLTNRMASDLKQLAVEKGFNPHNDIESESEFDHPEFFHADELSPILTEQSLVLIPEKQKERSLWEAAANKMVIEAWFRSKSETGRSTIFIQGSGALQDGDIWEQTHNGQVFRYLFKEIQGQLITLVALERVEDASAHIYSASPVQIDR